MKIRLLTGILIGVVAMTSCSSSRKLQSQEVDDVYHTKADLVKPEDVRTNVSAQADGRNTDQNGSGSSTANKYSESSEQEDYAYENNRAGKYGNEQGSYGDDYTGFYDDDYYYGRRIRRFNQRSSWNYYDPYYSYDIYYSINTPIWVTTYSYDRWWYDPYYYCGPSYTWTYSWGYSGYGGYYPYGWSSYYAWSFGWGRPYGGFYGGYYGGWGRPYGWGNP